MQERDVWRALPEYIYRIMDHLRGDPILVQTFVLFRAGLVPLSIMGDLGEQERRAACDLPRVWFTLDMPAITTQGNIKGTLPDSSASE